MRKRVLSILLAVCLALTLLPVLTRPVVASATDEPTAVDVWGWDPLGDAGFSAGWADYISLAIDSDGTPYVAYQDAGNSYRLTVMKYNGTAWEMVGGPASESSPLYISIAIDSDGVPYVAYADWGNSYKTTVKRYNGTAWEMVGGEPVSEGSAYHTSIAISGGGTPYVAYAATDTGGKVKMYNVDANEWQTVGTNDVSDGLADYISLAIADDGSLYTACADRENSSIPIVKKYNVDANEWQTVGGISTGAAECTSIAIDSDGTPYVAYRDESNSYKATVKAYNGEAWVTVGGSSVSADGAVSTSIAIDSDGTPYVAYQDQSNSNKATVKAYNGEAWVTVGGSSVSAGEAYFTSIVIDSDGTPYVAYKDADNGSKATVRKFSLLASYYETTCPICGGTALEVSSREQLEVICVNADMLSGCYLLTEDIDLAGESWTPLPAFSGHFYGGGHTISNLTVTSGNMNAAYIGASDEESEIIESIDGSGNVYGAGLFQKLDGASISDLIIDSPSVSGTTNGENDIVFAGALAGIAEGGEIRAVTVNNPDVSVELNTDYSNGAAGGLAGYVANITPISGVSVSDGTINATGESNYTTIMAAGGVAGASYHSVIVNAASATTVNVENEYPLNLYAGGVVGYTSARNVISMYFCVHNSYSRSNVTVTSSSIDTNIYAGGIAGYLEDSAINNYYVTPSDGGVSVTNTGETNVNEYAGALFGYVNNTVDGDEGNYIIENNFYEGETAVGGLVEADTDSNYVVPAAITTAPILAAALNEGRTIVASETQVVAAFTADEALSKVFPWKIDSSENDGLPVFGSYTIIFNSNGGSAVPNQSIIYSETATEPADPTKDNNTFGGWYSDSDLTSAFDFSTPITDDITLYAKWTPTGSSGGASSSFRTITVTETSSELFSGTQGTVRAEANVTNAFSSSVEVKVTDTEENPSGFGLGVGNKVYPFDISLYVKGTNTKTQPRDGYSVTITLPVPDSLLEMKEQLSVTHKADNGSVTTLASQLKQINGVWYLVFEATEFSPYALVVKSTSTYDKTAGLPYYLGSGGAKIFIGFADNVKYLAPTGASVQFMGNAKSFTDIGSHWAKDYIGFATERELFLGTGANAFSPDSGMTRAMFATVIGRLYERSYGEIETMSTHAFTDCDYGDYYGKYVDWAAENGILDGYGNGEFGPDDPVTREQMATILYLFADFLGVLPDDMDTALSYPDAGTISSYAESAALYCQSTGIITGRDGGSFIPQGTATRAEVAVILERFIENILG
ncbi:MAG: S-layer homology domain-containing protein [Eubacteriales bacterium]|nr:S-layer homology domain-containing protein [Eubacteriales bacterium]